MDFIDEILKEVKESKPGAYYDPNGDCIFFYATDELPVLDRIDSILTVYRSMESNQIVGFKIKGIAALLEKYKADFLGCASQNTEKAFILSLFLIAAKNEATAPEDSSETMRNRIYVQATGLADTERVRLPELVPS
ncbi:MAG: hypothetical protein V1918_06425 [Planctomycetota bacterium]